LVAPDITRGTGNFNLALGIAVSIGTALSTSLAGCVMDHFGRNRVWGLCWRDGKTEHPGGLGVDDQLELR